MSRRQTRLTPAEGGRFARPVGSPVPPTAGDLAGMRGDPPPSIVRRADYNVSDPTGPLAVHLSFRAPPKANPTLTERVHLLIDAFPYPPGVLVTGHVDDWRIQLYGSMNGSDRVDGLEVNGEDLDDAAISGVISLVVDKVIGRDGERKTRRYPVFSDLTPAEALRVATAPRTPVETPISGRFPNDADVIAARVLQLMPRYPGYGLAVLHNTGANGGVIIRVALAGRALDHILPQWELEASGAPSIDVDAIVGKLARHLDQTTGGHAHPVGGPTPESVAASIRAANAAHERRYAEIVERPAKPTETMWRLVDSAGGVDPTPPESLSDRIYRIIDASPKQPGVVVEAEPYRRPGWPTEWHFTASRPHPQASRHPRLGPALVQSEARVFLSESDGDDAIESTIKAVIEGVDGMLRQP